MTWFFAVLIVAAMGVAAVVATGDGGQLAEVYDDRPDARVPAHGPLTGSDLRRLRFSTVLRGYRMSEVDALLDRLAGELDEARARARAVDGGHQVDEGHQVDGGHQVQPGRSSAVHPDPAT
jgi:DivIVA domain-containing protein